MNTNRLAGHIAGSVAASLVWGAGAYLAPGAAPWYIWALGVAPQAVAAISLVIQESADVLNAAAGSQVQVDVAPRQPLAYRRENTRPGGRKELTAP